MSFFEFPHTRTYDSDLGWLIKTVKELFSTVNSLEVWKQEHEEEYNQLKALYDSIMSGNFPPEIVNAFNKWAKINMPELIKEMVKSVWFALTDDGYFIAYIPESWNDIIFNTTGLDITIPGVDYGHLTLSFETTGG